MVCVIDLAAPKVRMLPMALNSKIVARSLSYQGAAFQLRNFNIVLKEYDEGIQCILTMSSAPSLTLMFLSQLK